jgi:hypothetical protein
MNVTGLRNQKTTSGHFKKYKISDLVDKVDIVLTEHGFIRLGGDSIDLDTNGMYRVYKGFKGETIVRFVTDESKLIPRLLSSDTKKEVRCPVYIERSEVPYSIDESILNDLKKI